MQWFIDEAVDVAVGQADEHVLEKHTVDIFLNIADKLFKL